MRAAFLHAHVPYDRSLWRKLRSPVSVMLMAVAACPYWGVRAGFFLLYLGCLLPDRDEFQLMRFIQALKGTQASTRAAATSASTASSTTSSSTSSAAPIRA